MSTFLSPFTLHTPLHRLDLSLHFWRSIKPYLRLLICLYCDMLTTETVKYLSVYLGAIRYWSAHVNSAMTVINCLERFLFECREVIGFALCTPHDWLALLFHLIKVKPKPILTHSHAFSRAFSQLHVITWGFDWFTGLSVSFVIG